MDFQKKEWQFRDVISENELNRMEDGIEEGITKAEQAQGEIYAHITQTNNPHFVTKYQIGLGNVDNVQQIPMSQKGQPNGVATLDDMGKVPSNQLPDIAAPVTSVNGKTGDVILTAADVGAETPAGAQSKVNAHASRTDNPHGVTKAQVGLGNVQNYGIATQAQAQAGTANNVYMTPLRVKEAIEALAGIVATKPRTADYNSSDRVVGTWYTVVDVSGSGILSRISMGTNFTSGNNTTLEVEIRIDGTTYVASPSGSSGNIVRGLARGGSDSERARGFIDIFLHTSFRSNMRVRMRLASGSNGTIMGAVDYSLT